MDEEGGRGRQLLGAAFSISQMVQLLLPARCFAPHVYTRGGHSRKAEHLCSLSTLHVLFFFPISKEEFGHPFPSLQLPIQAQPRGHPERSPSFLLFPPPLHFGVGSCLLQAKSGFKAGLNGDKTKPCRSGFHRHCINTYIFHTASLSSSAKHPWHRRGFAGHSGRKVFKESASSARGQWGSASEAPK